MRNVVAKIVVLLLAVVLGFTGCGGGLFGNVKDACVNGSTCTDFTADRESNKFNCSSMTQGRGTFHPGVTCAQINR